LFHLLLGRCKTGEEHGRAQSAIKAIRATAQHRLSITPFSFHKTARNPAQRELITPFGNTGFVAPN
jgi:hypothetical protein